ncbi:MAG: type VI secretion system protein TssL, partial [Rhodobacterales bacterium]
LLRKAIPPPPPPAVINDDQLEVITSLLQKDIFENKITILSDTSTIILRIAGNGMFASGSDKLEAGSLATLTRVGFA